MPTLLLFTACERVILGEDKTISLIGVLTGANLVVDVSGLEKYVEHDMRAPVNWEMVSIWGRMEEDDDVGVEYEQHGAVFTPSGKKIPLIPIKFKIPNRENTSHRVIGKMPGFPIAEQGIYTIVAGLTPIETMPSIQGPTVASTWVRVIHETKEKPSST